MLGYVVVRRPQENCESIASGHNIIVIPMINGHYYWGYDRMPWDDIDDLLYDEQSCAEKVPKNIKDICESRIRAADDLVGYEVLRKRSDAERVREYLMDRGYASDIIAIYLLNEGMPDDNKMLSHSLIWYGIDVVEMGGFSILLSGIYKKEGIYKNEGIFDRFVPCLNSYGLFEDCQTAWAYKEFYNRIAKDGPFEEVGPYICLFGIAGTQG